MKFRILPADSAPLLAALPLVALLALLPDATSGHGYMKSPRSRNFVAYEDGLWWGGTAETPYPESCPHCLNLGGTLSTCGIANGRDYNYPKNAFGDPMPVNVQATYPQGSLIDIEVVLSAHHKGHFSYKICPVTPGEIPTQACFDDHPLEFVQDNEYGAPQDVHYPDRAYIPLATFPGLETDDTGVAGSYYSHKFRLPANVTGDLVMLQWHYLTANSCVHPGYDTYPWPEGFRDEVNLDPCGTVPPDGQGVPEQFWNCAEITITDDDDDGGDSGRLSGPETTSAAAAGGTTDPPSTADSTPAVTTELRFVCGASWTDAASHCEIRNPCEDGNATHCDYGQVCYADVPCETVVETTTVATTTAQATTTPPQESTPAATTQSQESTPAATTPPQETTPAATTPPQESTPAATTPPQESTPAATTPPQESTPATTTAAPTTTTTTGGGVTVTNNYCGLDWYDAAARCGQSCPDGVDSDCPSGESCFADTDCAKANRCGVSWNDAEANCEARWPCPGGVDSECPDGQYCYADVRDCGPGPGPVAPTTVAPGPAPTPPSPTPPTAPLPQETSRLIAYVGNWQACPTPDQYDAYTHIVIGFAVSYTWSPSKNICSQDCTITPNVPICNNAPNPSLVQAWKTAGKKVILSFGGAGMGGSWAGDVNDCWEYCYGRETSVINQLTSIVNNENFDGIDIDYEYFYDSSASQNFLRTITSGLRASLPTGSIVTHAPMDSDLVPTSAYYQILKDLSSSLDFVMPQYYNGHTRPALDGFDGTGAGSVSAKSHYDSLVNDMFDGDATKVVFGFCISDCSGTGSNANGAQAANVMAQVAEVYPCHGGAFFWVANHDVGGAWSDAVSAELATHEDNCAEDPVPTASPAPTAAPVPTADPTLGPTNWVVSTAARCGVTEVDARENCRRTCVSVADCVSGESCWGTHPNYCGSMQKGPWIDDPVVSHDARCGSSELDAREFCKPTCVVDGDCDFGEGCHPVVGNYCGSEREDDPSSTTTTAAPIATTAAPITTTAAPTANPTAPATTTTSTTTSSTQAPITPVLSTEPRCGSSEVDAREYCRPTCQSTVDCASGQWCWGVHANYCGSIDKPAWDSPTVSTVPYRCGTSEVHAREFCGDPCTWSSDCTAEGETCHAVNQNYCGSNTVSRRAALLRGR